MINIHMFQCDVWNAVHLRRERFEVSHTVEV